MNDTLKISLRSDVEIGNPEERIREYCDIEIYKGYDDRHSISNHITQDDIQAANELYAMIDRYDPTESSRIISSTTIPQVLAKVRDRDLSTISESEWLLEKENIAHLLRALFSIRGIGLSKATKILHLKRPKIIPILDNYVVKFLTGIDMSTLSRRETCLEIGLNAINISRRILRQNSDAFYELHQLLNDLPIPLTTVRLFDILCWTTEKWDIRGITTAAHGIAERSLRKACAKPQPVRTSLPPKSSTTVWVNVDKPTKKCTVHGEGCIYERRKAETPLKGIQHLKRDGGWLAFDKLEEAKSYCEHEWRSKGYTMVLHTCGYYLYRVNHGILKKI